MFKLAVIVLLLLVALMQAYAIYRSHKTGKDPQPIVRAEFATVKGWLGGKFDELVAKIEGKDKPKEET